MELVSVPYSLGLWLQQYQEYLATFQSYLCFSSLFIGIVAATKFRAYVV